MARTPVEAQQLVPPRTGLLSALAALPAAERMATGIAWEPEACGYGGAFDPKLCSPSSLSTIEPDAGPGLEEAVPFTVWGADVCATFQRDRDRTGRARRQLAAIESYQVARELWTGTLARAASPDWPNEYLAKPSSDVVTDGPAAATVALACLEQGIAEAGKGRRGMVHATPATITHWQVGGALRREGGLVLTINDTIVVADAGYDGSGPNGEPAADGSVWAYATELIAVRLGPVRYVPDVAESAEALNRLVNTVVVRAERDAVLQWDHCIHIAAEVDIALCGIGGS